MNQWVVLANLFFIFIILVNLYKIFFFAINYLYVFNKTQMLFVVNHSSFIYIYIILYISYSYY